MEQYKTENAKLEKDLPTLREIVGGTWKKEEELKQLKSGVAVLERKIQFELKLPEKDVKISDNWIPQEQKTVADALVINENSQSMKDYIITRPKLSIPETSKSFKI